MLPGVKISSSGFSARATTFVAPRSTFCSVGGPSPGLGRGYDGGNCRGIPGVIGGTRGTRRGLRFGTAFFFFRRGRRPGSVG